MRANLAVLRGWWLVAALVATGWVVVSLGQTLIGGVVMATGSAVALLMRAVGGRDERLGAVILRTRPWDLWLYTMLTVNVMGATLLVTRHIEVIVLAVADAVLLVWGAAIVLRPPARVPAPAVSVSRWAERVPEQGGRQGRGGVEWGRGGGIEREGAG